MTRVRFSPSPLIFRPIAQRLSAIPWHGIDRVSITLGMTNYWGISVDGYTITCQVIISVSIPNTLPFFLVCRCKWLARYSVKVEVSPWGFNGFDFRTDRQSLNLRENCTANSELSAVDYAGVRILRNRIILKISSQPRKLAGKTDKNPYSLALKVRRTEEGREVGTWGDFIGSLSEKPKLANCKFAVQKTAWVKIPVGASNLNKKHCPKTLDIFFQRPYIGCMETKSRWSNSIYPCPDPDCGYIGPLDDFSWGGCYEPCPRCGSKRHSRTGRFLYKTEPIKWFPLLSRKVRIGVEWRK